MVHLYAIDVEGSETPRYRKDEWSAWEPLGSRRARAKGSHLLQLVLHPHVPFWKGKSATISVAVSRMWVSGYKKKRKEKGRDVSAGSTARIPPSPLIERERAGEPQRWIIVCASRLQLLRSKDQSVDMEDDVFILHTMISYCQQFTPARPRTL